MAKTAGKSKPVKLSRVEKKAVRAVKKQKRRETIASAKAAFKATREKDRLLIPWMVIAGLGFALVSWALLALLFGPWIPIPIALLTGLLGALMTFSRRASKTMYAAAEGQPGAAAWLLENQLRGDWRTSTAVAGTPQLDAVHRVVGRPGVVLIGEGAPQRVRGLLAQEKKKVARVAPDTPIYDFIVGTGEGQVALKGLNKHLMKLPKNLTTDQVRAVEKRLQALSAGRPPLPQGPLPAQAKLRSVQRTARRRSG